MSRIDDLIKELAPNGVLFKPLGDVGVFIRGRTVHEGRPRRKMALPCIHYGEIHTHYGVVAPEDALSCTPT